MGLTVLLLIEPAISNETRPLIETAPVLSKIPLDFGVKYALCETEPEGYNRRNTVSDHALMVREPSTPPSL